MFSGVFWARLEASKVFLGASWGLQGVLGALLGRLLGLSGAVLSSRTDPPSCFGDLSGFQEALGGVLGTLLGLFGVILRSEKEPPSVKQIQARYWSLVFSSHWSLVARHSSLFTRL